MADSDPMMMQMLAKILGNRLKPEHIEGVLLYQGAQQLMKGMKPKKPPQPQEGGKEAINTNVRRATPGPGPIRSNATPAQLQALAALLGNPDLGQNLLQQPPVPPRMGGPGPGIPGVQGPVV